MPESVDRPPSDEDAALMRAYPDLFGTEAEWRQEPVVWGLEIGSGWRPLMLRLLDRLREAARADGAPVRITQIKEKFGELRVYTRGGGAFVQGEIRAAVEEAITTCEVCGALGESGAKRSPLQVLCAEHARAPLGGVARPLARRSELQSVLRSRQIVAVVDDWHLEWEGEDIIFGGTDSGSGKAVRELVVAVIYRPVPRAYAIRGWLELGKPRDAIDFQATVLEWEREADQLRDRLLGRR